MEHLSLEVFDIQGTGSKFASLPEDTTITLTDTSEVFASGDVWSMSFTLNTRANAHIFGTSGELHGSRLHEQINKRRARLWVEGLPLFLGYLKLDDEVDVDAEGNVDISLESGQKTFEERIEGVSATEVSVGDVPIGIALNRKRVVEVHRLSCSWRMDGLDPYAVNRSLVVPASWETYIREISFARTPYVQRWPKLVKSHGIIYDASGNRTGGYEDISGLPIVDFTNVQTSYDAEHPFCNINICYPFKSINAAGEEKAGRGYTMRLAHGKPTTDGGDNQTRFNNAPNFYLLYWLDRLFKDMGIHVTENQCLDVEDLRRVFLLNYGCHYEEFENDNDYFHNDKHTTPADRQDGTPRLSRYGQYYMPFVGNGSWKGILRDWDEGAKLIQQEDVPGKVLLREASIDNGPLNILKLGSVEGLMTEVKSGSHDPLYEPLSLVVNATETNKNAYSSYVAYATGDNYPHVEIGEIVDAMKSMFGVRLLFNHDYSTVRIILLRNVFRSSDVQTIDCDIMDEDEKVENSIRGFRMTYGKGTDSTAFYYKGFADLFPRASITWKDTSDKHDYSQWDTDAKYDEIKQHVSAFNRMCYITPSTGNAYGTQVDEDEDVLFPSLMEWAGYMDAEDGDCSGEKETIEEVQCGAAPVIMNDVNNSYAVLFSGDMKAPTPAATVGTWNEERQSKENPVWGQKIATFGRMNKESVEWRYNNFYGYSGLSISGKLDLYVSEGFKIRMEDNYAISNGGTPFDEADPGLCFGIMRSSGDEASVSYFKDDDDGEGNEAWSVTPGNRPVSHPDSCDNYGNLWDYNGKGSGTGDGERISLKLRAEKLNPYFDPKQPESAANPRYLHIDNPDLQGRGLCDKFYKEYSYWVRNARIVKRTVRMTLAQLLSIDKTKRVKVGDVTGFIRKMQYSISQETGLGNVVMEIMYI